MKNTLEKYIEFYKEINGWDEWDKVQRDEVLSFIKSPDCHEDVLYSEFYHAFNCKDWDMIYEISKNPSINYETLHMIFLTLNYYPNCEEIHSEIKNHKLYDRVLNNIADSVLDNIPGSVFDFEKLGKNDKEENPEDDNGLSGLDDFF